MRARLNRVPHIIFALCLWPQRHSVRSTVHFIVFDDFFFFSPVDCFLLSGSHFVIFRVCEWVWMYFEYIKIKIYFMPLFYSQSKWTSVFDLSYLFLWLFFCFVVLINRIQKRENSSGECERQNTLFIDSLSTWGLPHLMWLGVLVYRTCNSQSLTAQVLKYSVWVCNLMILVKYTHTYHSSFSLSLSVVFIVWRWSKHRKLYKSSAWTVHKCGV